MEVVTTLSETHGIAIEDADDVGAALAAFRVGRGDFADYLIRERSRRAGMLPVATFDEVVMIEEGFAGPAERMRELGNGRVSERLPRYGRGSPRRSSRKR